jgi:hypothetical protein
MVGMIGDHARFRNSSLSANPHAHVHFLEGRECNRVMQQSLKHPPRILVRLRCAELL